MATCFLALLETEWILNIVIEERSEQIEGAEVEPLDRVGHRDVSTLIEILSCEDLLACRVVDDISSLGSDQESVVVDGSAILVCRLLGSCLLIGRDNNVALVITVEVAEHVNLIKRTTVEFHILKHRVIHSTGFVSSHHLAHLHGGVGR